MIDEDLFSSPCLPRPKPAKLEGFVMSSSALLDDPTAAPLPGEPKHEQKTGRKGYTRYVLIHLLRIPFINMFTSH